jgi:hypothetical protein
VGGDRRTCKFGDRYLSDHSRMARLSRSKSQSRTVKPKKQQSTTGRALRARSNKKSKYFEASTDEDDSSFDNEVIDSSGEESPLPSDTDADEPPKKKSKVTPKKAANTATPKNKNVARSELSKGKKEESEEEEPWETFIPKEDTPDSGDIPYEDSRIHPNTLQFLRGMSYISCINASDLAENNDREWFWSHEVLSPPHKADVETIPDCRKGFQDVSL